MIYTTAQDIENRIWLMRRNNLPELRLRSLNRRRNWADVIIEMIEPTPSDGSAYAIWNEHLLIGKQARKVAFGA